MLRNVSRQQFVDAVEKGMVRNSGLPMPTLRSRLDLLEQALPALNKGDMLDFTYLPGAGTVVRGQGRELKIPGKDFADALFSVWLGLHADSRSLRHDLLGEKQLRRSSGRNRAECAGIAPLGLRPHRLAYIVGETMELPRPEAAEEVLWPCI